MGSKSGFAMAVKYGTYTIAGMVQWTMSGVTREILDDSAFGDETNKYKYGIRDGGMLTFEGQYDPLDTDGQEVINAACRDATVLGSELKLFIDAVSAWQVTSGGGLLVKKADAITSARNGLAKISFEAQVSNGIMELV